MSFAVTAKLICVFVFAYAKPVFSRRGSILNASNAIVTSLLNFNVGILDVKSNVSIIIYKTQCSLLKLSSFKYLFLRQRTIIGIRKYKEMMCVQIPSLQIFFPMCSKIPSCLEAFIQMLYTCKSNFQGCNSDVVCFCISFCTVFNFYVSK